MNSYETLKNKHQQEVNAFPFFFAFSNKQFVEGMAQFGLTPDDTDKIYRFPGTGGYYLRSDGARLKEMFERHEKEQEEAMTADSTGEGYIYEMFYCELANHEYGYTWDLEDTLDALELTMEEIKKSRQLTWGLKKAIDKIRKEESA